MSDGEAVVESEEVLQARLAEAEQRLAQEGVPQDLAGRVRAAEASLDKARLLMELDRVSDALSAYVAVERLGQDSPQALREPVASALHGQVRALERLESWDEAVAVANRLTECFGDADELEVRRQVAGATLAMMRALRALGRPAEVERVAEGLLEELAHHRLVDCEKLVARALLLKAGALREQGRGQDALAVLDELVQRYGAADDDDAQTLVAAALNVRGAVLGDLGRSDEALETWRGLAARLSEAVDPHQRRQAIRAVLAAGTLLRRLERWPEAVVCFDQALERLDEARSGMPDLALNAMYLKIVCLNEDQRNQETIDACDALLARYGDSASAETIGFIADAMWLKSRALGRSGELGREREVLRDLISRFREEPRAGNQVARSMYNEGVHLHSAGDGAQAVKVWDELLARFGAQPPSSDPFIPIRGQLAKSRYLAETGRLDQALATCMSMIKRCERFDLPDRDTRIAEIQRVERDCVAIARRTDRKRGRLPSLLRRR